MTSLRQRLQKLEAAQKAKQGGLQVPVIFATLGRGDQAKPLYVKYEGSTWVQEVDESLEQFKARVVPAAMALFKPEGRYKTLALCAKRPSLGREGWLAKHGLGTQPV